MKNRHSLPRVNKFFFSIPKSGPLYFSGSWAVPMPVLSEDLLLSAVSALLGYLTTSILGYLRDEC